jgi:Raf kinase inhibitor-like YbhB/YbcL family protein
MTSGPTTHASGERIAIQKVRPREEGRLSLASAAIGPDGRIADEYSAYHDNWSPPLSWTTMPEAHAWALIVEDPDAPREEAFLHWAIWNIPGKCDALPARLPADARIERPLNLRGVTQGRNDAGEFGWFGPKPPPGHGLHRYHFQLFALDSALPLEPTTPLKTLLNALKGLTIAEGELVGTYAAPEMQ